MYYKPCKNCRRRKTCEKFANLKASLRSNGTNRLLTSLVVSCDDWKIPVGAQVTIMKTPVIYGEYNIKPMPMTATVSKNVGTNGCIWLWVEDDELKAFPGHSGVFFAYGKDLTIIEHAPIRKICEGCGRPEGSESNEHHGPKTSNFEEDTGYYDVCCEFYIERFGHEPLSEHVEQFPF